LAVKPNDALASRNTPVIRESFKSRKDRVWQISLHVWNCTVPIGRTTTQALHNALSQHGFTNSISGTAGVSRLPTGFYYSTNRIDDLQRVSEAVKTCANSTGYANEVIVIRNGGWYGFLSNALI
jgi:hypothetical protein